MELLPPTDEEIKMALGFPDPERQAAYDAQQKRIEEKRKAYYGGDGSRIKTIDESKITTDGQAYLKRMVSGSSTRPATLTVEQILARINQERQTVRPQTMAFDDAIQVMDALYDQALSARKRSAYWSNGRQQIADDVLKYFIGDPSGPYSLHKGLFIYGDVGAGKTFLMQIMQRLCLYAGLPTMSFQVVATKNIIVAIDVAKSQSPLYALYKGAWCLDDIGEEDAVTKLWGQEKSPVDSLLTTRYEKFISDGLLTHFTSNKQPSELESLYGSRVADRMNEWVNFICLNGESLRDDTLTAEL